MERQTMWYKGGYSECLISHLGKKVLDTLPWSMIISCRFFIYSMFFFSPWRFVYKVILVSQIACKTNPSKKGHLLFRMFCKCQRNFKTKNLWWELLKNVPCFQCLVLILRNNHIFKIFTSYKVPGKKNLSSHLPRARPCVSYRWRESM